jgi:predicted nucleic acid-binding protein
VRFWDSSAVVPLLIPETTTAAMSELLSADSDLTVWWASAVECASALGRKGRAAAVRAVKLSEAYDLLEEFAASWSEVPPSDRVRAFALRFARVHDLSGADAFQLAAATVASDETPDALELVTLDERLAEAAALEGFRVLSG